MNRLKNCFSAIFAFALGTFSLGIIEAVGQIMSVPGQFGVGPTGNASYTIPIVAPPGTAGMVPSLSLAYHSQAGNGLLGMGWSLEGLPSIGRCPRTVAQDGVLGSINYDSNDRFCLDDQRLIAISGIDGANGTEYRTEIETFSKVISFGTAGTGPAWFEVRTKSGQIMQFGNSTDSRILAQGKPTARSWALNKVSDTKGNYFTVTYTNDTVNYQAYPTRIDYTGNGTAGLAPYNSVRFVYDSIRPDAIPQYQAGSLQKTTVRLTNVQTYSANTMVADYRLTYAQGSSTGRSQLTSVKLCDGAGVCLPATTFGWQQGNMNQTVKGNIAGQDGSLKGEKLYIGDYNGDGKADVLWADTIGGDEYTPPTRFTTLWSATGGWNFAVSTNFGGQNSNLPLNLTGVIADFNRDGRSDVCWYNGSAAGALIGGANCSPLLVSTNSGVHNLGSTQYALGTNSYSPRATIDTRGDGKSEIVSALSSSIIIYNPNFGTSTINGCTYFSLGSCSLSFVPGDFNGDGRTDILWWLTGTKSVVLAISNGNGSFTATAPSQNSEFGSAAVVPYILDVNGDGKSDIVWDKVDFAGRSTGFRFLWIGQGDHSFDKRANAAGNDNNLAGYRAYVGDFNGDGKADVFWDQQDTAGRSLNSRVLWLGKGDGNFTVITNFAGLNDSLSWYTPIAADFNGDGKTDLLWRKTSDSTRVLWLSDPVAPDMMTGITSGVGVTTAIIYSPLTDNTIYAKDNTAVDPTVDLQTPTFVVSRVDASNGIEGISSDTYAYAGAKANLNGRGFLGFRQVTTTDLDTNVTQITTYRQDFPFTGLVATETKKVGAQVLKQITNTYGTTALGGTRQQVFLNQSQVQESDLDGTVMPVTTSSYQYDAFGNATSITVTASDGFSKTTTNTYSNDTTNWLLGRLSNASVTSQTPP